MELSAFSVTKFKEIFSGNSYSYGQHVYSFSPKGEKEKGTNKAITGRLVTIEEYRAHLEGKIGLGIVPINSENKCKFVVIDIDVYKHDFTPYIKAIERHNIPIVPFRSKSGGYHLYIFFKEFTPVKGATALAAQLTRILGISLFVKQYKKESIEIFPKQSQMNKGDNGSWINLPYYNAAQTKQGVIYNGEMLNFDEGMTYITQNITTVAQVKDLIASLPYSDAPPCLQTLYLLNDLGENSGRNNYLFSFGVYLKKKDENYFEQGVMSVNNLMDKPLEVKEVEQTVLSSLRKKDYQYKCSAEPCLGFCDKKICKKREYGIGEGGYFSNVIIGNLIQYKAASPYYELEVKVKESDEFKRLRFKNEDELIRQDAFLRLCFRELNFLPYKLKQGEWFKKINQCLSSIVKVDVDKEEDTSPFMRFRSLFFEFLTERSMADTKAQILIGKVYYDVDTDSYYFRSRDFVSFLQETKNFREYSSSEIHGLLRDLHVKSARIRDKDIGKQYRAMSIKKEYVDEDYLFTVQDRRDKFEPDFSTIDDEEDF